MALWGVAAYPRGGPPKSPTHTFAQPAFIRLYPPFPGPNLGGDCAEGGGGGAGGIDLPAADSPGWSRARRVVVRRVGEGAPQIRNRPALRKWGVSRRDSAQDLTDKPSDCLLLCGLRSSKSHVIGVVGVENAALTAAQVETVNRIVDVLNGYSPALMRVQLMAQIGRQCLDWIRFNTKIESGYLSLTDNYNHFRVVATTKPAGHLKGQRLGGDEGVSHNCLDLAEPLFISRSAWGMGLRVLPPICVPGRGRQKQSNDPHNNQHNPQYANYWAPLTRKRHIPPHSAQPRPLLSK